MRDINWYVVGALAGVVLAWIIIYRLFVLMIRAFDSWGWLTV